MSAFRRGNGWVSKFQYRGRQHWTPGGPWATKAQAREAERRYRDRLAARRTEETCASFAERWLEEWSRPGSSTRRNYAKAVRCFAQHFGPTPLGEVRRFEARTWALSVPRYVSRTIRTMYADAANVGLVDSNPFTNLRLPATERRGSITAPTMEQYRTLLDACLVLGGYGPEFRVITQFSAWTGIPAGELHALEWGDVELEVIQIRRARRRDGSIGPPKNGKARTIAYLPPARVLDSLPRRPDPYVFHSPHGRPLDQGSHFYAWREVRAQAGLRHVRWHDWRHFCATQLLELGIDHFAVSIQLGHTDGGALVMERYGHPSQHAARGRLLGAFSFEGAGSGSATGSRRSREAHGQAP
jgi:integrase